MDKQPHLLVCISAHGFGHVAQTAPVLNALYARMPNIRITIRSMTPLAHLRSRIHVPFNCVRDSGDIGMLMSSAMDVRDKASSEAYHVLHRDWGTRVMHESETLRELAPDFVLSNVGYLPLAGADRAGIPCAAMSSLNWADIFSHYCNTVSGAHHITTQILVAYNNADAFLQLTPAMPMTELYHRQLIGPVADIGKNRIDEINACFNLVFGEKLVLVSLGGVAGHLPMDKWPRIPGVRWLVPMDWRSTHPDALPLESLNMPFGDILASCDAFICKPGYGSFVEAACSGVPVLYASRPDWPETPILATWLKEHGVAHEVDRSALESGNFVEPLEAALSQERPEPVSPTGVVEAVDWLVQRLGS